MKPIIIVVVSCVVVLVFCVAVVVAGIQLVFQQRSGGKGKMKSWEDQVLGVGQFVSAIGCIVALITFMYGVVTGGKVMYNLFIAVGSPEDRRLNYWPIVFFFGSILPFFFSWAMWIVFSRVKDLPRRDLRT